MSLLLKIWSRKWMLRSIFSSIYFNFHYLPFRQAIYLPIILYKCKFIRLLGKIELQIHKPLRPGIITLGRYNVSIYPNNGIIYENNGGTIIFNGSSNIGNNSAISIGKSGVITFGDGFSASSSLRLVCYNNIQIKENVRVGWDCIIMDTDFHRMKRINGGYTRGYGKIEIGKGCWFANRCVILKNTKIPDYCTFSSGSVLNKKYDIPFAVYGPADILLKREGIYRDIKDDIINYEL